MGVLYGFLASVNWAIASSVYASLSSKYQPSVINCTRGLFGFVCGLFTLAFLFMFTEYTVEGVTSGKLLWLTGSILSSYGIGDAFFILSSRHLGVSSALAIGSTAPLFSALIGMLFLREYLSVGQWFGIGITVVGLILVVKGGKNRKLKEHSTHYTSLSLTGVILAVATAFCWAMNGLCIKEGSRGIDALFAGTFRMAMAMPLCIMTGFLMTQRVTAPFFKKNDLLTFAPLFIFEAFLGGLVYTLAFKHSSLGVAATITSLYPLLAFGIAVVRKVERFSVIKALGMGFVLSGIYFVVTKT